MKFLIYLVCYCLYPWSFLFPRSKKKWAFGSFRGAFNDNAKYLYIQVAERVPEIHCAWLSVNRSTVDEIKSLGLNAYWVFSPKGLWFALTSKVWFFNSYSSDIMFCLSGGAKLVNLWHGLPLKRIEFGIESGPLADRFVKKTLKERYYHPECYQRPDYVLSSTRCVSEAFARAFRVPINSCIEAGYPRNEILCFSEDRLHDFIRRYESLTTADLVSKLQGGGYSQVFVYMPTWRDSQRDLFVQRFDLERMNAVMHERNALLLLKPHSNMNVDVAGMCHYSNILFVDAAVDMYPILPFTDVLITDYSSVLYDYILMEDKSVILYLYDYEEYAKERDFFFTFEDHVVGKRVYDFEDLCHCVEKGDYAMDEGERARIVQQFWGDTVATSPSEQIISCFRID